MARWRPMRAAIVDLPLCLQQLRSTLSDEDRRSFSCHASGSSPSVRANSARSRASRRSSASATITPALQSPQYSSACVRVGLQSPYYHGSKLQPLGGDQQVHLRSLVQLSEELCQ